MAQIPAFPGALGFGANATGGRTGTVYHVTTLANSGAGSFRDAVSQPNRIIVFDVGGYITISSEVAMNDNLTIAGQTAPGGGIGITGNEVSCGASTNLIIRHLRFRPGSAAPQGSAHCLNMYGSTNVIVDHVSFEFAPWNNIGGVNIDKVTIQNCLVANPINQQFGAHIERVGASCAFLYNIWVNGHNRQPLATINTIYLNNVIYNYSAGFTTHTSGFFFYDIINNYFITGPASSSPGNAFYQVDSQQSIYSSGNLRDSDNNGVLGGSTISPGGVVVLTTNWSPVTLTIPTFTPATAYRCNVSSAGAWPRDAVDDLVVSQVKTLGNGPTGTGAGTAGPGGGLYTSQTQTGLPNNGFGILNGGAPSLDSDQDGMPDYWEISLGSNLNSNDATVLEPDGYARIEKYLNWLADLHTLTSTNVPVVIDLWKHTSGFTNAGPVYVLDNATNGSVTLSNSHFAVFTPAASVAGLGSFRFRVSASDGTAYTNTVVILISSLPTPSNLIWQGDGIANTWSVGGNSNWLNDLNPTAFTSGDNVTFDDSGSTTPSLNLPAPLGVGNMFVVAAQDYTIGGSAITAVGSLQKVGTGKLTFNATTTFLGGATINEGIVQLGDGASLNGNISGNITNNDTLILANPTSTSSSASINGSGEVIKRGAGTHTLSGTQTYTNLTTVEAGVLAFSGTPPTGVISNAGGVTFNPAASLTHSGRIIGPGLVTVSASGQTITLSGSNTFTGGLNITAGNLALTHNNAAGAGPVTNSSSGLIYVGSGVVVTNDLTFTTSTTDLNLRCDNGTGTWAGNVTNLGSGVSFRPGSDGGTLIFTGNALIGARNFIVPRGSVQFASNSVISATGSATAFGRDGSAGNRSANVTIRDNAVVTLGVCNLGGGQAGGNVTVTLQNNAQLNCSGSFDLNNVNRTTATTFLRLNGGVMTVGLFTKTKTSQTNVIQFNGGVLRGVTLPAFNASSNWVQAGGAIFDSSQVQAPLLHDPSLGSTLDGGLTKLGSGTLVLEGTNTYTGGTIVSNGWLTLLANGSISNTAFIRVDAGATLHANNTIGATLPVTKGYLSGNGTILGRVIVMSNTTLTAGMNGIGKLTCNHELVLQPGSTSYFEIDKTSDTNDVVQCGSYLTLGGSLVVTNISGEFVAGDSFKLFNAAVYSNAFNAVILPPLNPGLVWNTNQLNTAGTIAVVSATPANPPVFGATSSAGNNLVMSGSNGTPNTSYYVLTSTNAALPMVSWSRVATNQFDASGIFNLTNPVDPATPQLFYRLQLP